MKSNILIPLGILIVCIIGGCSEKDSSGESIQRLSVESLGEIHTDKFSGDKAFAHVKALVDIGPRPPASEGYAKMLTYLEGQLNEYGWTTRRQTFKASTPEGPVEFTNLIARHSTAPAEPDSLPFLLGGHIDTKKLPFPFVGANDGGSSTGVILEIARVLSTSPKDAAKVEIVLFDGEEAFREGITARDGLYGSKYFAHEMSTRPTWPAVGIVLDIVGDLGHTLLINKETPKGFTKITEKAADEIQFVKPVQVSQFVIIDDHVPLQNTGLPCLHLIGDFTKMPYWHQEGDTIDKVDPRMLEMVGKLTLEFMSQVEAQ